MLQNVISRFDERTLLIIFGVVTAIVGRAAFFPFPGVDNPAVCVDVPDNCTIPLNPPEFWTNLPRGTDSPDYPQCFYSEESFESLRSHSSNGRFVGLDSFLIMEIKHNIQKCNFQRY